MSYNIKRANLEDCPKVLKLIKSSFTSKNLGNFELTLESLQKNGFGKDQIFYLHVVAKYPEDILIGYSISSIRCTTWRGREVYVEDLYIASSQVANDLKKKLLKAVCSFAKNMNSNSLTLACPVKDLNGYSFYLKLNADDITITENCHYLCFKSIKSLCN